MGSRPCIGHRSAQVVADNADIRVSQLSYQLADVLAHCYHIVAVQRPVGEAKTTQIRGNQSVTGLGKPGHDQTPFTPVLRKPMQQHYQRTVASDDVVDTDISANHDNVVMKVLFERELVEWTAAEGAVE